MPLIRIQEHPNGPDGSNATLVLESGEYPIIISNPFSEQQEQDLEWYFEDHLSWPFLNQVRAQQSAESITAYGEALFKQVFADTDAYALYKEYLQAGLNSVQIEIAGSPAFHGWHWEALKDPKLPDPIVLQATMVRKNTNPQTLRAKVRPSPTINLLIVTARPFGKSDAGYRTISRPLVDALQRAQLPVKIDILRPGTYKALENHLHNSLDTQGAGYYHMIHFDVHGELLTHAQLQELHEKQEVNPYLFQVQLTQRYGRSDIQPFDGARGFLLLEGEKDQLADLVEASELANLLLKYQIPIAILNACQSGKQIGESETSLGSRLMQSGVQMVLAMGYSVTVTAAEVMMTTLYQQLFHGRDLPNAIRSARTELFNRKGRQAYFNQVINLEDWLLPVVYQNQPQQLTVRSFTPEEEAHFWGKEADRYNPPQPTYGFVGRDLDSLQIEKHLLTRRNLLLIRGMGGAGKTTLLQHLASWWQKTGFVEQVFYFGYDQKAWNRQQIMDAIAQKLLNRVEYATLQPLPLNAQQARLAQLLRSHPHLLILDNLESITGTNLAILHPLPVEEQQAIQSFLAALAGGKTLVLLGSRGDEAWLSPGTFADNIYDLAGLDPEAASLLADAILEHHKVSQYREESDLQKLLKLLDGFPLALEIVLSNLARQTPAEILTALQAGDIRIDPRSDTQEKTKSILKCIDYSHSNLSPEAQTLLSCLAPFTSIVDRGSLTNYTQQLKRQPALASLPFERWAEVIKEATHWGLLNPDPDIPRFLRLQPIFPYFLRNRFNDAAHKPLQQAIETAFREHYDQVGDAFYNLLKSKDAQERQIGQVLVHLEYENLATALNLALAAQASILNIYGTLSAYLDTTQGQQQGLALGQTVLSRLEDYATEKLAGPLGAEFVGVIDDIANRQRLLKQYKQAEASYQKALSLWLESKSYDADTLRKGSASIYHQLGIVAQEQRKFEQAEQYYRQALQIYIEYNDRHTQAMAYHQLGRVAEEQRQWAQAQQYYQQALQIYIDFNDRYEQSGTYHQLGVAAQEQRQWTQAEQYYQQALQIYIDFNDRYEQAGTYHQLGRVAQEQRQWVQAGQYYQKALEIFVEHNDDHNGNIVMNSLARLWQESGDATIPAHIASILGIPSEEVEAMLRQRTEEQPGEEHKK